MDYFKYDVVCAMNITDVDDKVNTVLSLYNAMFWVIRMDHIIY